MKEIHLYDRQGNIKAVTVVDDDDLEIANLYRWYLSDEGYAVYRKFLYYYRDEHGRETKEGNN